MITTSKIHSTGVQGIHDRYSVLMPPERISLVEEMGGVEEVSVRLI